MKSQKMKPLTIFHLILMIVFCLGSLACVVGLTIIAHSLTEEDTAWKSAIYSWGTMNIFSALAMMAGIAYLCKGYSKQAAGFYKAFLVSAALSVLTAIMVNIFSTPSLAADNGPGSTSSPLIAVRIVLCVIKVILLFTLAFGKDLGKRSSWILFGVLLGIDVLLLILSLNAAMPIATLITFATRFLMDGTIGLALKGKYDDKDARGTT